MFDYDAIAIGRLDGNFYAKVMQVLWLGVQLSRGQKLCLLKSTRY